MAGEGVHVTLYPMMDVLPLEGDQEKITSLSPTAAWKLPGAPNTTEQMITLQTRRVGVNVCGK